MLYSIWDVIKKVNEKIKKKNPKPSTSVKSK